MVKIHDAPQQLLIENMAVELRKTGKITPPAWADFVKTGSGKARVPDRGDWWYVRSAAVLRKVALLGPIGVSKLRTKFGGKKRRGHQPPKFRKGSGAILRKVLQQLESAGLVKKQEKSVYKGRILTPAGQKLIDATAKTVKPKPAEKKPEPKPKVEVKVETKEEKPVETPKPKEEKPAVKEAPKVEKPVETPKPVEVKPNPEEKNG